MSFGIQGSGGLRPEQMQELSNIRRKFKENPEEVKGAFNKLKEAKSKLSFGDRLVTFFNDKKIAGPKRQYEVAKDTSRFKAYAESIIKGEPNKINADESIQRLGAIEDWAKQISETSTSEWSGNKDQSQISATTQTQLTNIINQAKQQGHYAKIVELNSNIEKTLSKGKVTAKELKSAVDDLRAMKEELKLSGGKGKTEFDQSISLLQDKVGVYRERHTKFSQIKDVLQGGESTDRWRESNRNDIVKFMKVEYVQGQLDRLQENISNINFKTEIRIDDAELEGLIQGYVSLKPQQSLMTQAKTDEVVAGILSNRPSPPAPPAGPPPAEIRPVQTHDNQYQSLPIPPEGERDEVAQLGSPYDEVQLQSPQSSQYDPIPADPYESSQKNTKTTESDSRQFLMDQIKQGTKLKKVEEQERKRTDQGDKLGDALREAGDTMIEKVRRNEPVDSNKIDNDEWED